MKVKLFLAASAVALAAATNAQAADVVMHNPAPVLVVPAFSWSGFYVGAQGNYLFGKSTTDTVLVKDLTGGLAKEAYKVNYDSDTKGWMGGVFAGFNTDFYTDAVFGVETDFAWGSLENKYSQYYEKGKFTGDLLNAYYADASLKTNWAGATRLRVGYSADRVMPYLAAGVAYTSLEAATSLSTTTATDATGVNEGNLTSVVNADAKTDTLLGWTAGVGVDYAATDNVLVRLEYRYSDYGDKEFGTDTLSHKINYSTNDVRLGVAFKF